MKSYKSRIFIVFLLFFLKSETNAECYFIDTTYLLAYDNLNSLLASNGSTSFKKAVFITENAFNGDSLSYKKFCGQIENLTLLAESWAKSNPLINYHYQDSSELNMNFSIYKIMKDTIRLQLSNNMIYSLKPFVYDFNDFFGKGDWTKMFVTKLLRTNSGNCHSMPYLYKILADELGVKNAWLSFAPYHIYLKNHCMGMGWYNTELTSGQFPVDAWIMASGYVPADAVRNGIYMDTLSNQQAVANCVLDLAKGYEKKYRIYTDSFIIKCCDLTLKYHPTNINAIVYKAETLKKMYLIYIKQDSVLASSIYSDMEKLYMQALDLGYKEMPEKMYKEWILAISRQKDKYSNKKLKVAIRGNK